MFLKLARSLVLTGLLAFIASPAFALTATDWDTLDMWDLGFVMAGSTLAYEHTFDPLFDDNMVINSTQTWLVFALADDWNCAASGTCLDDWSFQGESGAIDFNSMSWQTKYVKATIFWGDVTAEVDLLNSGGVVKVSASNDEGNSAVLWSWLVTKYDYDLVGGGTLAVPEPSAALVFAIGALVMGRTIRRRQIG